MEGMVSLERRQIGDEEAKAIAEALKVNNTVTELFLSWNQIGDVGAQAIAEAEHQQLRSELVIKDQELATNKQELATRDQALAARDQELQQLRFDLAAKDQKLATTEQELIAKSCWFAVKDQELTAKDQALATNKQELATKDQELQQLRSSLAAKDQALAAKDQELQQLRIDLAAKDQKLATTEQELIAKNQQLAVKAQELTAKDQALATNKQELATKDQELQQLCSNLQSALDRIGVLERNQPADGSFSNFDGPIPQVSLATLVAATNNFAADSLLGEGAFGRVYGASLPGPRVAIKKLSAESKQGTVEFKSELDSLSKFRHANIIAIMSYAEEGDERCLVYEFMPNGSVRDRLSRKNNTPPLTWSQRHRIAADVARGMHYVQTAFPDHVLFHLDLKTDNVLLDAHFNAKVSDFGLVRAAQHLDERSYLRTQNVQGTAAYMCPDFFDEGRMTIKTDVYAFGMILLELLTAVKPSNRLKGETRKALKNQKFMEMLDSALKPSDAERQSITEMVTLALECLDDIADDRPSFGSILVSLDP